MLEVSKVCNKCKIDPPEVSFMFIRPDGMLNVVYMCKGCVATVDVLMSPPFDNELVWPCDYRVLGVVLRGHNGPPKAQ